MESDTSSQVTSGEQEMSSFTLNDDSSHNLHNVDCDSSIYDWAVNRCQGIKSTDSGLNFDDVVETEEEKAKRAKIEEALKNSESILPTWQKLALEEYGLVNDDLRRKIWPLLLCVDPDPTERSPLLSDLSNHSEFYQVVLDVNRSLKRFPPSIPYKQRVSLQDQLSALKLRLIMKYPYLRYYQEYHDVALTFLLVVGETVAFRIMERLSTDHLRECMDPTMERTTCRLNYIYPILQREDKELFEFMDRAMVGVMFSLPWYLTWFSHSLNQYRDVVRLYDYFLASPPPMPLYVAASLVIERRHEIFDIGCDMAGINCLLSHIPDDLDFEFILLRASSLYMKYPPNKIERDVKTRVEKEVEQRRNDDLRLRGRYNRNKPVWMKKRHYLLDWLLLHYKNKYGLLFATTTLLVGFCAYYMSVVESG